MSQSPIDDFSPAATARYSQGWRALYRMINEGRSFSGHERHCAFLNTLGSDSAGRFADVSAVSGLDFSEDGRALVLSDWDFDGKLDVWIASRTAPRLRLMRNAATTSNHFVAIRLIGDGRITNRDAIGARVELTLKGESDRPLIRTVHAGDAFLSQSSSWLHFGLGENSTIEEVVVRWPGGESLRLDGLEADRRYIVRQSAGAAAPWEPPAQRKELIASATEPVEPGASTRTVLPSRLPLPSISTHDDPTPLDQRLSGATLITLWSATCAPCIQELQEIAEREDQLRRAGLQVTAVNLDSLAAPTDDANAVLELVGFPFGAEQGTEQLVKSLDLVQRSVFDLSRDLAVPTSFLVDGSGGLAAIYRGPVGVDQVLADASLLDAPDAALHDAATPFRGTWLAAPPTTDPLRLAAQLLDNNLVDEAVQYLQQQVESPLDATTPARLSDPAEMYYVLGVLHQAQGDVDGSINAFQRALEISPNDVRAHKELATLLAQRGQIDAAAEQMAAAASISPDDVDLLRMLASLRLAQGRFADAIGGFQRVVSKEPGDLTSHYNLANAYRSRGDVSEAIERYELILNRQPTMALAANNLAWIRATHPDKTFRDGQQALRLATQICAQSENESFLDTLAAARAEAGQFEQAVATVSRALALLESKGADADDLRAMQNRLKLYQQRRPFRDVRGFNRDQQ